MILKISYLYESTGVVDPGTNMSIRTTRRVRDEYRKADPDKEVQWHDLSSGELITGPQKGMPNFYVSKIIEETFAGSASKVGAHFDLKDGSIGEIRIMLSPLTSSYDVFVSSIKQGSIDIISFQRGYYRKKGYAGLDSKSGPSWYKTSLPPFWYGK
jgi:hypothetical protein